MITVEQARRQYEGADAIHDFDHVLRVLTLAERLGKAEGADLEIVRAAALLHDGGRGQAEARGLDHAAFAANRVREILAGQPPEKIEAVVHAIAAHRFRSGPEPESLEAQVLFDADKLDAIGAVGIARVFAYGGAHGQRLWTPAESVNVSRWKEEGSKSLENRAYDEILRLLNQYQPSKLSDDKKSKLTERMETEAKKYGMDNLPEDSQ